MNIFSSSEYLSNCLRNQSTLSVSRRGASAVVAVFCTFASTLHAQAFDPINELFRWGPSEHLVIDRGGPVDAAGDVNGDGLADLIVGAGKGSIRVIFGPTNGNNGVLNGQQVNGAVGFAITHESTEIATVAGGSDFNDDGFDDVLIGLSNAAHVIFGGSRSRNRIDVDDLDGRNGFTFTSPASSVSDAGDINGDGITDLLIGYAKASPNGLTGAGVSYVIFGSRNGFPAVLSPQSLNGQNGFAILGNNAEARSGKHVGKACDFNADGIDDILIGAPNKTQGDRAEAGEAYLVLGSRGPYPRAISLADINGSNGFVFTGSNIQDSVGASVSCIGDLNHDGLDDIAIGAPGKGPFGSPSDYPGEVYVLFGGSFAGVGSINEYDLDGINGFKIRGIRGGVIPIEEDQAIWGDLAGTTLDAAGDINNDGIDDLVIGASHTIINPRRKGVGQTYFIYGSPSAFPARLRLLDLDGNNGFRINGMGTVDYFGVYVRRAGDFNIDGVDDVIVGASGQGESYVIYGRDGGLGRQAAAITTLRGNQSSGYPDAAFSLGPDAGPLPFRELEDPTGPTPFATTTSSTLGDPATPNYRPPGPSGSVPALRPATSVSAGSDSDNDSVVVPTGNTAGDTDASQATDTQPEPDATAGSESTGMQSSESGADLQDDTEAAPVEIDPTPQAPDAESTGDPLSNSDGVGDGQVHVGGSGSGALSYLNLAFAGLLAGRQFRRRRSATTKFGQ